MTTRKARLVIFDCWFFTFALCVFILFLAIPLRRDIAFAWEDVFQLATPVASLYMPVLTAFGLFWFRPGAPPNTRRLPADRWLPAFGLTLLFQVFMSIGVAGIVLFATPAPDSNVGLFEQVSGLVQWITIFSPTAMLPAAFLLGVEQIRSTD